MWFLFDVCSMFFCMPSDVNPNWRHRIWGYFTIKLNPGHWHLQTSAPSAYLAWGSLATIESRFNQIDHLGIENNREPEVSHTHVMALSSIHGARTFPRQGGAEYVWLKSFIGKLAYFLMLLTLGSIEIWASQDLSSVEPLVKHEAESVSLSECDGLSTTMSQWVSSSIGTAFVICSFKQGKLVSSFKGMV